MIVISIINNRFLTIYQIKLDRMETSKPDSEPDIQIKNLDTGDYISADELIKKNQEFQRMRSKSLNSKTHVPADLQFTTFTQQMKKPLFTNLNVQDYYQNHKDNVWCVAVSKDGKYAASGGEDGLIVLYKFTPMFVVDKFFKEHTSDVVMLEFSQDGFLISCSLDSTVKIWHPSQEKSLGTFEHQDAVTSVSYFPTDSSMFLAATLGNSVFAWSIRKNEVQHVLNFVSPPTATAISKDGKYIAIGCLNGFVFVYVMPDFRYVTQFIAGPRGKKCTSNKKVTSIEFIDDNKFLIATNDSRIRLYSLENFSVIRKYIGHESKESQLKLSVSSDTELIMTPSENTDEVYIYPIEHEKYFKGSGLFSSFLKDRSKTAIGFKYGKKFVITAAAFTPQASINQMAAIVADSRGGVSYVISN